MKLIKSFHFSLLFLLLATGLSDKILIDYGNGNKGHGVNDQVNGVNNTWIGDQNSINGNVNKVVGDSNKVTGSNNIVQGSNNVVGDMSPEEVAQLQNKMLASLQNRFKGVFNFASFDQTASPPKPVVPSESPASAKKNQSFVVQNATVTVQPTATVSTTQKQLQNSNKTSPKKIVQKLPTPSPPQQENKESSILLFRSYGSSIQLELQDFYYLEEQAATLSDYLCARWNYCLHKNRDQRWAFTSIFPSFPLLLEL